MQPSCPLKNMLCGSACFGGREFKVQGLLCRNNGGGLITVKQTPSQARLDQVDILRENNTYFSLSSSVTGSTVKYQTLFTSVSLSLTTLISSSPKGLTTCTGVNNATSLSVTTATKSGAFYINNQSKWEKLYLIPFCNTCINHSSPSFQLNSPDN